jgi:hypothetical protein
MTRERVEMILVVIVLIGAVVSFMVPMPWAAISAAIALTIAIPLIVRRKP